MGTSLCCIQSFGDLPPIPTQMDSHSSRPGLSQQGPLLSAALAQSAALPSRPRKQQVKCAGHWLRACRRISCWASRCLPLRCAACHTSYQRLGMLPALLLSCLVCDISHATPAALMHSCVALSTRAFIWKVHAISLASSTD